MAKEIPTVGDPIYIPSESYLSHGADDVQGGLTRILSVEASRGGGYWVTTEFDPTAKWSWNALRERQDQWAKAFGDKAARQQPDYRPEFNKGWTDE